MLFTPAYIFTILLGIWVLSLVGCIALGIVCYRLIAERKSLRARLDQLNALVPGSQSGNAALPDASRSILPPDADHEPDAEASPRS